MNKSKEKVQYNVKVMLDGLECRFKIKVNLRQLLSRNSCSKVLMKKLHWLCFNLKTTSTVHKQFLSMYSILIGFSKGTQLVEILMRGFYIHDIKTYRCLEVFCMRTWKNHDFWSLLKMFYSFSVCLSHFKVSKLVYNPLTSISNYQPYTFNSAPCFTKLCTTAF